MSILALADDMTGALEVGAKFSAAGIRTLVSAKPAASASACALVYDTETRHRSPRDAGQEVRRFVLETDCACPRLIYKKTDSTFRGNIAAEASALAELYPAWRIGYAPAYPALGRTVKNGLLYVDGVAVAGHRPLTMRRLRKKIRDDGVDLGILQLDVLLALTRRNRRTDDVALEEE